MVKPIVPHATDKPASCCLRYPTLRGMHTPYMARMPCTAGRTWVQHQGGPASRSRWAVGALDDHQSIAMYDRTVVPGAELSGEVAGSAAEQGRQFVGVVVHQPTGDHQPIRTDQLDRLAGGELTAYRGDAGREQ